MTLDKAPLAIDGVLTGASSLRKGLMAAIGGGGVVRTGDLKVSASVPNGQSLQIAPGLGVVPNGYQTTPDEVYVEANPTGHAITSGDMPSASASTTYWLVCLVVGDPSYGDQTGHPFMPSDFDESQANTFQYVRPVLLPCSSTTTTFEELGKHYPGLALARIAIPPSTTTITEAMITDVRKSLNRKTADIIPTLNSPWSSVSGRTVSYHRDRDGYVHIEGTLATLGTSGTAVFQLQDGFKPDHFTSLVVAGSSPSLPGAINISTDGTVTCYYSGGTNIALDGITFLAA